jgi:glycosyltransferase involved in cell wall biosynthesis
MARLAIQKRIDRLIEVTKLLPSDVHVVVAGDGTRRDYLEKLARRTGVAGRVHFLGHRDDKDAVYDALDVFVITSDSEGLSNAMLEAMTRGLPIVSTPVSGADDALLADGSGSPAGIVAGFSAQSIADAIRDLINSPEKRHAMGSVARDRALNAFSLDRMLDKWEAFLAAPDDGPMQ